MQSARYSPWHPPSDMPRAHAEVSRLTAGSASLVLLLLGALLCTLRGAFVLRLLPNCGSSGRSILTATSAAAEDQNGRSQNNSRSYHWESGVNCLPSTLAQRRLSDEVLEEHQSIAVDSLWKSEEGRQRQGVNVAHKGVLLTEPLVVLQEFAILEGHDCGITLDFELLCDLLATVARGVDLRQSSCSCALLHCLGSALVSWLKRFAVSAPRCVELHHQHRELLQGSVKGCLIQDKHSALVVCSDSASQSRCQAEEQDCTKQSSTRMRSHHAPLL
mmetsp:Transcript_38027/g.88925  ORF Transcript_38027/g.88925 Transcript_38027/m.88925 type:complete len:274 (+) Transcript_38027:107-928(+)